MKILGKDVENADLLFAAVLLVVLYLNFGMLSTLKEIPSPLYGGDLYNGLGGVNHIMAGGSIFSSAQMTGEIPWVPWLYHLLVSIYGKLTGADAMTALIWFSLPVTLLSAIVCYLFVSRMTKSKYLALSGTIVLLIEFPLFKYSDFAAYLVIPAFFLMLYEFVKNQNVRNAAITGILLGLAGLSNTQAFFVAFMVLFLVFAVFVLPRLWREKKLVIDKDAQETIKLYAVVFVIGFAISMLFWFWPIFVFHGKTANPIQQFATPDATNPTYLWDTIINYSLMPMVAPYTSGLGIILTLLLLAGVAYAVLDWKSDEGRFILALLATVLLGAFHPLVTMPLLGMQLINYQLVGQVQPLLQAALIPMGLLLVFRKVTKEKGQLALIGALLVLSFVVYLGYFDAKKADQWYTVGTQPIEPVYAQLETWIDSNTNVNNVFLTTNENGFMMNALTGRKVLSYRRTHSSPYTDVNARMADQAVIAYGTNATEAYALLKKYNVKYLLWSTDWITTEFSFNQQGHFQGFFDPLDIPNNASNRAYWDEYGVKYLNQTMVLDPTPKPGAPVYPLLIAIPYQMDIQTPYNPQLLQYFDLKETIQSQGQDVFRIYERKDLE